MPISHDPAISLFIATFRMLQQERFHFLLQRRLKHLARPLMHQAIQHAASRHGAWKTQDLGFRKLCRYWIQKLFSRNLCHGVSFCPRRAADENELSKPQQNTPPFLSLLEHKIRLYLTP
jgi:hypothetical protein